MDAAHKKILDAKQFNAIVIILMMLLFTLISVLVTVADPCFHYHMPLSGHRYPIFDGRYQNNGIVRNFRYNAIITGTSMTENFKTSEMNELFDVNAVKVPYAGGTYCEISDNLFTALEYNQDIKLIIWGIDYNTMLIDKNAPFHAIADSGYQYPWYIIDNNLFNDVNYIMNKNMILRSFNIMAAKGDNISFDTAYYWGDMLDYGKEAVLKSLEASYSNPNRIVNIQPALSKENANILLENLKQNILGVAQKYPNVDFYLFIPPYSICFWDYISQTTGRDQCIEILQTTTKELLRCENIKLFAFWNNYEMITDLDLYADIYHYSPEINSRILCWMAEENSNYLLTKDNYQEYWNEIQEFYSGYDYKSLYEQATDNK